MSARNRVFLDLIPLSEAPIFVAAALAIAHLIGERLARQTTVISAA